jgi:plastocyanin
MRILVGIVFMCVVLTLAACTSNQRTVTPETTSVKSMDFEGNVSKVFINISSDRYSVDPVSIQRGTAIIWMNNDPYVHQLSSSEFGLVKIKPSEQWGYRFDTKGIFPYFDKREPNKQLRIIVN